MRGRQRVASRDHISAYDKEGNQTSVRLPIAKPAWRRSLWHVVVASVSSFLYGYHVGVVNETLESISIDLGFSGNTLAEGLVVSTCLVGAFLGSLFSGWIADGIGRRRSFQLCALPMIIGAGMSATAKSLWGMLLGRLFVGTGMGLGPPVAALYVAEVSPPAVRGTFGGLTQIATCLGLMGSLFIGFPSKGIMGWWRACFWVSIIPAVALALFMEICAESPHWLLKLIRDEIRSRKSDKEIYNNLEDKFGESILYKPKFDMQTAALWLSPFLVAAAAAGVWAYNRHRQKTNVHIMALNLVRGVPLTPKEKETMLDILTGFFLVEEMMRSMIPLTISCHGFSLVEKSVMALMDSKNSQLEENL